MISICSRIRHNYFALLLIDIQNDYFPGGAMECECSIEAGENAGKLLKYARENNILTIHIRHISKRPGALFFLPGTKGSEFYRKVTPITGESVIIKHYPNSFKETNLSVILQSNDIRKLIISGMMTHMCIDATTRAAADLGFSCILVQDACATRSISWKNIMVPAEMVHVSFIGALSGIYAEIYSTEEIINSSDL